MLVAVAVLFLTVISAGSWRYFFEIRRICARHRGGEERDVLVVRGVGQDRLDVLGEAHVEHLVGLVEHQEAQLGQVERALLEVVHDPAGGADDDVDAAAQRAQLDAVALAAVDRQHAGRRAACAAYRSKASHTCSASSRVGASTSACGVFWFEVEPREDRQRERRGLAGAGLGEADDVAALEERSGSVAAWIGDGVS